MKQVVLEMILRPFVLEDIEFSLHFSDLINRRTEHLHGTTHSEKGRS